MEPESRKLPDEVEAFLIVGRVVRRKTCGGGEQFGVVKHVTTKWGAGTAPGESPTRALRCAAPPTSPAPPLDASPAAAHALALPWPADGLPCYYPKRGVCKGSKIPIILEYEVRWDGQEEPEQMSLKDLWLLATDSVTDEPWLPPGIHKAFQVGSRALRLERRQAAVGTDASGGARCRRRAGSRVPVMRVALRCDSPSRPRPPIASPTTLVSRLPAALPAPAELRAVRSDQPALLSLPAQPRPSPTCPSTRARRPSGAISRPPTSTSTWMTPSTMRARQARRRRAGSPPQSSRRRAAARRRSKRRLGRR